MDLTKSCFAILVLYCHCVISKTFQQKRKDYADRTRNLVKKLEENASEGNRLVCIKLNTKDISMPRLVYRVAKVNALVKFIADDQEMFSGRTRRMIQKNNWNGLDMVERLKFDWTQLKFTVHHHCHHKKTVRKLLIRLYRRISSQLAP